MKPMNAARRLVILLTASFALTILSFLFSRLVSEIQSREIEKEANVISQNALIATEALLEVRNELRRTGVLLQSLPEVKSPRELHSIHSELEETRRAIRRSWAKYASLPPFPAERSLITRTESRMRSMEEAIDSAVVRASDAPGTPGLSDVNERALAEIDHVDANVRDAIELNRREAQQAARSIARRARSWGLVPDLVSASFATAAAYFVIGVVRRYLALSEERSAELEHFAGRVAHDIRSPLSSVALALELAKRSGLDPTAQTSLDRGIQTLQRMGQLVDGLLVFAVAGTESPKELRATVRDVIDGIVEDVRPEVEQKNVELDYARPDPSLIVACSPGVLASMTSNLIGNAIKYLGDSIVRRVTIRVCDVGNSVRVDVSDTGPGIPPELQKRIFLPHVRGTESMIPGLGLGLAIVRRLAEAHGGEVGVESTVGSGSRFWFQLPRCEECLRRSPAKALARLARFGRAAST